jgi:hypothetical protein
MQRKLALQRIRACNRVAPVSIRFWLSIKFGSPFHVAQRAQDKKRDKRVAAGHDVAIATAEKQLHSDLERPNQAAILPGVFFVRISLLLCRGPYVSFLANEQSFSFGAQPWLLS